MPVKHLPAEVLIQIFERLWKDDLYTCVLVCKNWESPVAQVYFEELNLKAKNIYKVKTILSSTQTTATRTRDQIIFVIANTSKSSESEGTMMTTCHQR